MYSLNQNIFNSKTAKNQKKFKLWTSVGLMITYKCSAACRFCYYNCNPKNDGLMPIKMCLNIWKELKELSGESAGIHITGGEPFLYYDHLCDLLQQAASLGLGEIDQIETNASWAINGGEVEKRLKFLKNHNINILKISCDPFHQEFIDTENVKLLYEIGLKIFGKNRVLVRWQEYLDNPIDMKNASDIKKADIFYSNFKKYPFRFTGRAAFDLAKTFEDKSIEFIGKLNCSNSFLSSKGIHIDPFGNIFSGVCSGIIVGNVNEKPITELWKEVDWINLEYFNKLYFDGPCGLLEEAKADGFCPQEFYAGKCQLCSHLRQFFFDKGQYKKIIGPMQCYSTKHVN